MLVPRMGDLKFHWAGLLTGLIMACATVSPTTVEPVPQTAPRTPAPTLRLPKGVTPVSVELQVRVEPTGTTVSVKQRLKVKLEHRVDQMWVNAMGLTFANVSAEWRDERIPGHGQLEGHHFASLTFDRPMGPGEATLVLETTAPVSRREPLGIFATTEGENTSYFTQFEPLGARRAWPCFDEPSFKVPWQLTITAPAGLTALSNTPAEAESTTDGQTTVRFAQTLPLPSYLVAFAVGAFDVVDGGRAGQRQVPVRILTPRGHGAWAKEALAVTPPALEELERYFGTPYPFEKIDHLAINTSTWFGAMEHPGLITWAESLLLAQPEADTIARRREMVATATHELAHQWFGNLVTPAWWDDLWLNESFAQWMEARTLRRWKTTWGGEVDRVLSRDVALSLDTLPSARRMHQAIETHDDVLNAFDGITYGKGDAVLHMFEAWLGAEVFQRGVQSYLGAHAWGNATTADFLEALSEAAGRDVTGPLGGFIDQNGAPVIRAELECEPRATPKVVLSQSRAVPPGVTTTATLWHVPVCLEWPGGRQCTVLNEASRTVTLDADRCPAWVLPNDGFHGFYRSGPLSPSLVAEASLPAAERAGALSDLGALTRLGQAPFENWLTAIQLAACANERPIVDEAIRAVDEFRWVLPARLRPRLATWVTRTFGRCQPRAAGDVEEATLLRTAVQELLGTVGADAALRNQAVTAARRWLTSRSSLAPDDVASTLSIAAHSGEPRFFEELVAALGKERDRGTRAMMFLTLGAFEVPALATRARGLVLAPEADVQETLVVLQGQLATPALAGDVYRFVTEHYDELTRRLPVDQEAALVSLGARPCTTEHQAEFEAFFKQRTTQATGGPRTWALALEELQTCIAFERTVGPQATRVFERLK